MSIPLYGVVCVALGFLLGAVSALALVVGLVLAVAGRRRSSLRRIGAALAMGSMLPAAVAVAMVLLPDAVGDPDFKQRADAAALAVAPGAAAVGLAIGVLGAWALRPRSDRRP